MIYGHCTGINIKVTVINLHLIYSGTNSAIKYWMFLSSWCLQNIIQSFDLHKMIEIVVCVPFILKALVQMVLYALNLFPRLLMLPLPFLAHSWKVWATELCEQRNQVCLGDISLHSPEQPQAFPPCWFVVPLANGTIIQVGPRAAEFIKLCCFFQLYRHKECKSFGSWLPPGF